MAVGYFQGMQSRLRGYIDALWHCLYPQVCLGCGNEPIGSGAMLCARCLHHLPATGFFDKPGNPVEKCFYGRIPLEEAGAAFYFTKKSLVQQLLVALKYQNNPEAGYLLGRLMGHALKKSERFQQIDAMVPIPLNRKKEFLRGYNQSAILCYGIQQVWHKPVLKDAISRPRFTKTQTLQNRIARWQNMEGVFAIHQPNRLAYQHLLLVDDVVTTGATIEACAAVLHTVPGVKLSVAAAAYTI